MNIDTLLGGKVWNRGVLQLLPEVKKPQKNTLSGERTSQSRLQTMYIFCVCGHGRVCVHTLCSSSFGYPLAESAAQNRMNSWGLFHNFRSRIKSEDFPLILNLSMTCFHEHSSTKVPIEFCSMSEMRITDLMLLYIYFTVLYFFYF